MGRKIVAMDSLKSEIAAVAARIVVEEGQEYGPAKHRAVKQMGLPGRTAMPDNDAVEDAVIDYIALFCAETQPGELLALRRLEAGMFNIAQAKTIEQLTAMSAEELQHALIAIDSPLQAFPAVCLSELQTVAIKYGQSVQLVAASIEGTVRLYHDEVFLGLGEMLLDGKIAPKRLFNMDNP